MTHHTVSHEGIAPCVHSLSDTFTRLLWIPSLLAQWAPWCEVTASRPVLDSHCSSDVSHLSFLNRNFRKHLKHSSGLLLQASIHRQMLNRLILLLHLLSKRMHSPACLHILSSALSTLRVALYHSVFLVLAFTRAAFHPHQLAHGIAPALKMLPTLTRIQFLVPMKTLSEQLAEQSRAGESAESATPHNWPLCAAVLDYNQSCSIDSLSTQ